MTLTRLDVLRMTAIMLSAALSAGVSMAAVGGGQYSVVLDVGATTPVLTVGMPHSIQGVIRKGGVPGREGEVACRTAVLGTASILKNLVREAPVTQRASVSTDERRISGLHVQLSPQRGDTGTL